MKKINQSNFPIKKMGRLNKYYCVFTNECKLQKGGDLYV